MTANEKFVLRSLLTTGFNQIEICCGIHNLRVFNPTTWIEQLRHIKSARILAAWLRTLSFFSAIDFDGFDENAFWLEYERIKISLPGALGLYKQLYEQELLRLGED